MTDTGIDTEAVIRAAGRGRRPISDVVPLNFNPDQS